MNTGSLPSLLINTKYSSVPYVIKVPNRVMVGKYSLIFSFASYVHMGIVCCSHPLVRCAWQLIERKRDLLARAKVDVGKVISWQRTPNDSAAPVEREGKGTGGRWQDCDRSWP